MDFYEEKLSGSTVYSGRILRVRRDTVRLPDGSEGEREIVEHSGGVVILAITPARQVYMVRQFRYAFSRELLEVPAGKLEAGEAPLSAAQRELEEETGLQAQKLVYLGPTYPSPGFCNEVLHLYLALGLTEGRAHPDADEFLAVELHGLDALIDRALAGELPDGKSINALFLAREWLQRHPEALQGGEDK